jgi:hypothetical protein
MKRSLSEPNSGRRSFLWKAGAAVTAAAAAAVPAIAKGKVEGNSEAERLAHKLGILEDERAIRTLHKRYENLLDAGKYEEIAGLFSEDASVVFNGGMFEGKRGVGRLYRNHFSAGRTGRKIGPVPGHHAVQETVTVAADRRSARGQFSYAIQVGKPMTSGLSLVDLARLHGEGIMKWCECGVYEISYTKNDTDGSWKIARLEHRVESRTDYRPGRAYANPIAVAQFAKTYPADPSGPDSLVSKA